LSGRDDDDDEPMLPVSGVRDDCVASGSSKSLRSAAETGRLARRREDRRPGERDLAYHHRDL